MWHGIFCPFFTQISGGGKYEQRMRTKTPFVIVRLKADRHAATPPKNQKPNGTQKKHLLDHGKEEAKD